MSTLRLFMAIKLPDAIGRSVLDSFYALDLPFENLRVVPLENLHLTVKFLGSTPLDLMPDLTDALYDIAADAHAIELIMDQPILLPPRNPRTVGVCVQANPALLALFESAERILGDRKLAQLDRRSFSPHITLARVTLPLTENQRQLLEHWKPPIRSWAATALILFESQLAKGGPNYIPLTSAALA